MASFRHEPETSHVPLTAAPPVSGVSDMPMSCVSRFAVGLLAVTNLFGQMRPLGTSRSIFGRLLLHVIDYQNGSGSLLQLQLQSKLFLDGSEDRRSGIGLG